MNTDPNPSPLLPATTTDPSPPADLAPEEQKQRNTGRGHISHLPLVLRDKVGAMVLDGVPYAEIITSLGEAGQGLVPHHITTWKSGTFRYWQRDYERRQAMVEKHQLAQDLVDRTEGTAIPEAGLRVAAVQMNEFLLAFDPATFAEALAEKPELYLRLINTISRVNESTAVAVRTRDQQATHKNDKDPSLAAKAKKIVSREALTQINHQIKLM